MAQSERLRVYTEEEAASRLGRELPRWSVKDGALLRRYRTSGWRSSLLVIGAVGHLAELAWHHPEIVVRWGWVEVRLRTHERGGITDKDFALARKIEEVMTWRPEPPLAGIPEGDPRFAYLKSDPSAG